MLVGLLQAMDLSKGLALLISSPGGDGLAAERIISVCRNYSGTGEFLAIVPGQAKSAATMICFGASSIFMGPTSELGPVDPQVLVFDEEGKIPERVAMHHIVNSYKKLFRGATRAKGNLEPYLQQLNHYDARIIAKYESLIELSEDVSIKALSSGMMNGKGSKKITEKIDIFLTPSSTKTHGRPIYRDEAKKCGLDIEFLETKDQRWQLIYELYLRSYEYVNTVVSKCIENKDASYVVERS